MGTLVGLLLGAGLFCVWWSCWVDDDSEVRGSTAAGPAPGGAGHPDRSRNALARTVQGRRGSPVVRVRELLVAAELPAVGPAAMLGCSVAAATAVGLAMLVLSGAAPVAACFAVIGGWAPWAVVSARARKRRVAQRQLWPDVVDHLTSAVRAGLALPEALAQLGSRGPVALRPAFEQFADDYRVSGRFGDCLDALADRLADPVADRVCEALRITREVGGSDLGRLLRSLSAFLREDARTRAELEARQTWTVAGARLAVAAPWLVLAALSTEPSAVASYNSAAGVAVLLVGAAVSLVAYRLMLRVGRLPVEERVLR